MPAVARCQGRRQGRSPVLRYGRSSKLVTNLTSGRSDGGGLIPAMRVIAVVLYDGMRIFDYAVVAEVWGVDRSAHGVPGFELRLCSAGRRPVTTSPGIVVRATHGLGALATADLVVVPGSDCPVQPPHRTVLRHLAAAHRAGIPVAALCGGAFVLAHAGLLAHRRATTHWLWAHELRRRFPDIDVREEALFVEDGRVWTSAGTAAGIDLCLHLVREAHGGEAAAAIARRMVTMPHRSGSQRQYIETPISTRPRPADPLSITLEWARAHLGEPLTVHQLACQAGMSDRTFARRFTQLTGTTPLRWLHHQRALLAQELLESTDLPIEEIARRTGYGSAPALRRHFHRVLGTTPTAHREAFHARKASRHEPR